MRRHVAGLLTTLAVCAGLARPAQADPQECIAANERGSTFKSRGELTAARSEYLACTADTCPKVIRDECASLIGAVDAEMPTVMLVAVDGQGNDAIGVRVEIDGRVHSAGVDGRAFPIDPGEHEFRFWNAGGEHREVRAVIREGHKGRAIRAQFAPSPVGRPAPKQSKSLELGSTSSSESRPAQPVPVFAYVLAATGAVALGSFTYFALTGNAQKSDLQSRCAPGCLLDEADSMQAKYLVADISLGIAAISLGGATYLYLTRPATPEVTGATLSSPTAGGLRLGVRGQF